jgi:hypothetical protein
MFMNVVVRVFRSAAAGLALVTALAFAPGAQAAFHLWQIEQVFSNADRTVQFIVMHESSGASGERFLQGHSFRSTHDGVTNTFPFPNNLPNVSTAGKRFLIATQGFANLGILAPDYVVPNGFLGTGAGSLNFADVDFFNYPSLPTDGTTAINRSGQSIPNVATNFAGQSASVTAAPPPQVFGNFQGLWWAAPAGSESGWGINLNHQGTTIFATWFTYGLDGIPTWYVVSATSTPASPNTFTGNLFTGTGPPFDNFDPMQVVPAQVGSVTFTFSDANTATFAYDVSGVSQSKTIVRELFGAAFPTCVSPTPVDLATATNFQDIWWKAPADSESGWGVNFTHQGDTIFASWFTYGADGKATWFVVALDKTAPNQYSGSLVRPVSGPPFNAVPFDPGMVSGTVVGTASLAFSDGNNATFTYTVDGTTQSKPVTRQIFVPPGTICG